MNEKKIADIIFDILWRHAPLNVRAILMAIAFAALGYALCMMAGCANIHNHANERYSLRPYSGTVECADAIATAFRPPRGPEGDLGKLLSILFLPVWIVDLPLEVVADTVTLPYDLFKSKGTKK